MPRLGLPACRQTRRADVARRAGVRAPARRALLAAGLAVLAAPAAARSPRREVQDWTGYEARLRDRLDDAGGGRFDGDTAAGLLTLTNAARGKAQAPAVAWSEDLARAARAHAADLAARSYVEHLSPDGFDPTDRLGLVARQMIGSPSENIAFHRGGRPADAEGLMALWRASPPHWTNLLRRQHSHVGFGVVRKGDRAYAVGLYARPDGMLPAPLPFRAATLGDVLACLRGLPGGFTGFWLEDQLGAGERGSLTAGEGRPRAAAGVYRLRLDRPAGGRAYQSLYGPIFVWRGG